MNSLPVALVYGVAGIGKTALAATIASQWTLPVIYSRFGGIDLAIVLDDARRQLTRGPISEIDSVSGRLMDLAGRLDDQSALWFADDLHHLPVEQRRTLLEGLSRNLRSGRFMGTSRERVVLHPDDADRLEVALDSLDEPDARAIWSTLDELYGPVAEFGRANQRACGNPYALRRAHAGGAVVLESEDPLAKTVAGLFADELTLAQALSCARIGLREEVLSRLLAASRGAEALRGLHRRLLLHVDGDGQCTLHDSFGEAVRGTLSETERVRLHGELAEALTPDAADSVVLIREVAFHWFEAGQGARAGQLLQDHARLLVRLGAVAELVAGLDAVGVERTAAMETTRARGLCRVGRVGEAVTLLQSLVEGTPHPAAEFLTSLVQAATLAGRLTLADQTIERLPATLFPPKLRFRADRLIAVVRALQGRCDDARLRLRASEQDCSNPTELARLAMVQAFTFWAEGRYKDAIEPMSRAHALLARINVPRSSWRLYVTTAALQVRLGWLDAAEQSLEEASGVPTLTEDNIPYGLRVEWAILSSARGDRLAAIRICREAMDQYRRRGIHLAAWWAALHLGYNLLLLGRRAEAVAVLDTVVAEAVGQGAPMYEFAAESVMELDPLRLLEVSLAADETSVSLQRRTGAVKVLRSAVAGELVVSQAQTLLAELEVCEGYAFDRALILLARALPATAEESAEFLEQARSQAAIDHADPGLIDELYTRITRVRVVDGRGKQWFAGPTIEAAVTLDGRNHELRHEGRTVSLARSPVARELLYCLASAQGEVVPKSELVGAAWKVEYHPLRHDNALRVAIRRLRVLLDGTELEIETDEQGYRLRPNTRFAFVLDAPPQA